MFIECNGFYIVLLHRSPKEVRSWESLKFSERKFFNERLAIVEKIFTDLGFGLDSFLSSLPVQNVFVLYISSNCERGIIYYCLCYMAKLCLEHKKMVEKLTNG